MGTHPPNVPGRTLARRFWGCGVRGATVWADPRGYQVETSARVSVYSRHPTRPLTYTMPRARTGYIRQMQ